MVLLNRTAAQIDATMVRVDGMEDGAQVNTVDSVAGKTGAVTLVASDITDFDTEVSNNTDVTANTAKVSYPGASASETLTNKTINTSSNTLTIGQELDLGANSIGGTAQSATGDGTTTINWGNGNVFNFQFGAFNETFTFTAPTKPGTFLLKLVQDSVGSRTATWPASVKWPSGTAPTLTTTATTGTDVITFYYDGTDYFAVSTLNFS